MSLVFSNFVVAKQKTVKHLRHAQLDCKFRKNS